MNSFRLALPAAFALSVIHPNVCAQPTPSPEQMQQIMQGTMKATMGAMVDAAGPLTEAAINAQTLMAARPETAERLAAFKKNLYDALMKQRFTAAQAMQIVLATQPPAAAGTAK